MEFIVIHPSSQKKKAPAMTQAASPFLEYYSVNAGGASPVLA
jgi:hypothetical protein